MLFDFTLTVPAGTLRTDPVITLAPLTRGKLTEIRVFFPPGPATLVHVVIRHNLHQLAPANYDGDMNLDDGWFITKLDYELVDMPYSLSMIGWSPETIYLHNITCQFNLEPVTGDDWNSFNRALLEIGILDREFR